MQKKSYRELCRLETFSERFAYLKLDGSVASETFGSSRWVNQDFYKRHPEWKRARRDAIVRDNGCDLGIDGLEVASGLIVHHINPITEQDILENASCLFDLDNLICVSHETHNAIHYGDAVLLSKVPLERKPNDTCLWKGGLL